MVSVQLLALCSLMFPATVLMAPSTGRLILSPDDSTSLEWRPDDTNIPELSPDPVELVDSDGDHELLGLFIGDLITTKDDDKKRLPFEMVGMNPRPKKRSETWRRKRSLNAFDPNSLNSKALLDQLQRFYETSVGQGSAVGEKHNFYTRGW